jgi:two-component system sensor histidine kinase TctE
MIYGDRASLRDLVENLVHNAISYTPDGGEITVSLIVSDCVELVVEDTGPGIPLLERERVFDRFYRLLGSEAEGSGLGLSIVKEIVEAHGGKISITDGKNGVGCKFSVSFTAAVLSPGEQPVANPPVHAG